MTDSQLVHFVAADTGCSVGEARRRVAGFTPVEVARWTARMADRIVDVSEAYPVEVRLVRHG